MAITLPRRSDARKGRQPTAPDGSKAHEAAESKEMEQEEETSGSPEGEEGSESYRNGSKKDYRGRPKPSRQRSAKGAGNTKAPMDSDCGCGSKKGGCSCKGKKDGGMGGPGELYSPSTASIRQKNARDASCGMRRGDSLSVHEYLAACDLGIQNQPTGYIRARLDATERLDLKCGKGAIRQGQKCSKGAATAAQKNPHSIRGQALHGAKIGAKIGAGVFGGIGALQGAALGAVFGGPVGAVSGAVGGAGSGAFLGAVRGGLLGGAAGAGMGAVQKASWRPPNKRRDSIWAEGFQP